MAAAAAVAKGAFGRVAQMAWNYVVEAVPVVADVDTCVDFERKIVAVEFVIVENIDDKIECLVNDFPY